MRPVIGITPNYCYTERCFKIHEDYFNAVWEAGGEPTLLYPQQTLSHYLDGIVLSGGGDVDPLLFGEEPLFANGEISPIRDSHELLLCKAVFDARMPMLGVCRGMQIMALASGGSIYQDIQSQTKSALKHSQQAPRFHPTHTVEVVEHTLLHKLTGQKQLAVNSFHHQAISATGNLFAACATSADGLIEAMEQPSHLFCLGLQWHPEAMATAEQKAVFTGLINASRLYAAKERKK